MLDLARYFSFFSSTAERRFKSIYKNKGIYRSKSHRIYISKITFQFSTKILAPTFIKCSCTPGNLRMIIQSLRLRSNSRTCWQVVLKGLSQEIRASPGASQVENPPAYKLLPKILSLFLSLTFGACAKLLFQERINELTLFLVIFVYN